MSERNWQRDSDFRPRSGIDDVRARALSYATQYVETVGLSLGGNEGIIGKLTGEPGATGESRVTGITTQEFATAWPSHDAFITDLFCELANQAKIDRADTQTLLTTWQYLSGRVDDLRTAEGRRRVLIDVIRTAAEYNFEVVTASNKWRTYAALSATIMSWPEGEARTRVLDALRESEFAFVETMESFYRNVLPTIGYRLKPEFHNDYQPFVVAAASVIEGLGIVRATVPALVEAHFEIPAEDNTDRWSVASLAFVGVVDAFIEPNPEFVADDAILRLSTGVDVTPQANTDD